MDRHAELKTLAEQLSRLVEVLRLDPDCQWRGHFEQCLQTAKGFLESSFTPDDLSNLSSSVMHVYGGMGSFSDYAPTSYDAQTGRRTPIPGTATFDEIAGRVYDGALSLRVVGHVA
jgi:hypothetical protein